MKNFMIYNKMRPGMSDGRCFTTYLPNVQLNENILQKNKINNNSTYRAFLQKHTDGFIEGFEKVCMQKNINECDCLMGMKFEAYKDVSNVQPYDPNA